MPLKAKETSGYYVLSGANTGKINLTLACAVQVPLQTKETSGQHVLPGATTSKRT
jgi:hypothetical protein